MIVFFLIFYGIKYESFMNSGNNISHSANLLQTGRVFLIFFFSFNAASKFHKCLEFCLECVGCSLFLLLVGGKKTKQSNTQQKKPKQFGI